jgi:hypothetical protein
MTAPTLPGMWDDILTMFNAFIAWDAIRGPIVIIMGLFLAGVALMMVNKVAH